jgi:cyclophilin family peptidyl-prolyl cis-trans isomerase
MWRLRVLLFSLLVCVVAWGQEYKPVHGETVMKIAIEGRGNIFVHLEIAKAPKTCAHIMALVQKKFYDGLRFYRVERNPRPFIAMVGDPGTRNKDLDDPGIGTGGSGHTVPYEETHLTHAEGTVSLATLPGRPDSGDSQFFFCLDTARYLDGKHPVFGHVVGGIDIMRTLQLGDKVKSIVILKG